MVNEKVSDINNKLISYDNICTAIIGNQFVDSYEIMVKEDKTDMIHAFNQTIEYIESVLDDEIDEKKIAYLSGYSYPMFSRIFSIMASYSLSEYIRLRKLTKAAIDLIETTEKVIVISQSNMDMNLQMLLH